MPHQPQQPREISIREFRANLAAVLASAAGGEVITVVDNREKRKLALIVAHPNVAKEDHSTAA